MRCRLHARRSRRLETLRVDGKRIDLDERATIRYEIPRFEATIRIAERGSPANPNRDTGKGLVASVILPVTITIDEDAPVHTRTTGQRIGTGRDAPTRRIDHDRSAHLLVLDRNGSTTLGNHPHDRGTKSPPHSDRDDRVMS